MFKLICVIILCASIGFGACRMKPGSKEYHLGIGQTKSGEPCRIIDKWDDRYDTTEEYDWRTKQFLQRNSKYYTVVDNSIKKYDCYYDIDTQEYKLEEYEKKENLAGFKERLVFKKKDASTQCSNFEYNIRCEYRDLRTNLFCYASGRCTDQERNIVIALLSLLFLSILIGFGIVFVVAPDFVVGPIQRQN